MAAMSGPMFLWACRLHGYKTNGDGMPRRRTISSAGWPSVAGAKGGIMGGIRIIVAFSRQAG